MSEPVAQKFISVRLIVMAAAAAFEITENELRAFRRRGDSFRARAAACLLAREMTGKSYPQVGRSLGHRDHTTIMHAEERAEQMRRDDPDFAVRYEAAKMAVKTVANSKLAELIREDAASEVAARICTNPSQADRVSTLQIISMAVRLVTLEELAADALRMLADVDLLVEQKEPAARLRNDLSARITAITESLAELGYVTQPAGAPHV